VSAEFRDGPNQEAVRHALREAVERVLHEHGELPTRWVLLAEAMGGDGERSFWLVNGERTQPWDVIGMTGFADALTRDAISRRSDD
jgi:hypothetical protein